MAKNADSVFTNFINKAIFYQGKLNSDWFEKGFSQEISLIFQARQLKDDTSKKGGEGLLRFLFDTRASKRNVRGNSCGQQLLLGDNPGFMPWKSD